MKMNRIMYPIWLISFISLSVDATYPMYARQRAIELYLENKPVSEIEVYLGVSKSTIYRWINIYDKYGTFTDPNTRQDRSERNAFTAAEESEIVAYMQGNPAKMMNEYYREVRSWKVFENKTFSDSTFLRLMQRNKFTRKRLVEKASERNMKSISEFPDYVSKLPVEVFVWTDEAGFTGQDANQRYGYALSGLKAERFYRFNARAIRWNLLAAMSIDKFIATLVYEMNTDKYMVEQFIEHHIVPEMGPFPGPMSVLVLDNAAFHDMNKIQSILNNYGAKVLALPPYAPHLNPIEHLFGIMKKRMRTSVCG